jgi:hypothetical protein
MARGPGTGESSDDELQSPARRPKQKPTRVEDAVSSSDEEAGPCGSCEKCQGPAKCVFRETQSIPPVVGPWILSHSVDLRDLKMIQLWMRNTTNVWVFQPGDVELSISPPDPDSWKGVLQLNILSASYNAYLVQVW